ncbi:hypothetical protein [Hansschlegelia sp. KR7-227]|uniref:hypothetical protein n=1 Tax=Hansschlegelia sp. KR7-227 TaxID=3400914 RepID=UPI003BFB4B23
MTPADWIAIYAAVVATGAAALEIRRWFESGPKLVVSVMADASMVGGGEIDRGRYLVATVTNRGDQPTTITHFGIVGFKNPIDCLLYRMDPSYLVLHPQPRGHPPVIPGDLQPGKQWMGMAQPKDDVRAFIETGKAYVAIYASHSNKPTLKRIHKPDPPKGEDAEA